MYYAVLVYLLDRTRTVLIYYAVLVYLLDRTRIVLIYYAVLVYLLDRTRIVLIYLLNKQNTLSVLYMWRQDSSLVE